MLSFRATRGRTLWNDGERRTSPSIARSGALAQIEVGHREMLRATKPADYSNPAVDRYPFLMAHAIALLPDDARVAADEKLDLDESLRRAGAPWRQARLVSVLVSILLVPGTWLLARRFIGDAWALLAAHVRAVRAPAAARARMSRRVSIQAERRRS
jgi:hypothetical protein